MEYSLPALDRIDHQLCQTLWRREINNPSYKMKRYIDWFDIEKSIRCDFCAILDVSIKNRITKKEPLNQSREDNRNIWPDLGVTIRINLTIHVIMNLQFYGLRILFTLWLNYFLMVLIVNVERALYLSVTDLNHQHDHSILTCPLISLWRPECYSWPSRPI